MTSMQADSGMHAPVVLLGTFNMSQRTFEQDLSDWLATHPSLSTVQPPLLPPSPLSTDLPDSPLGRETATAAAAAPPPPQPAFPPLIPDMVAIALQEFAPYPDAFLHGTYNLAAKIQHTANLIRKTLLKTCPGYQFSLLSQVSQVGMTLFVFSRDESMTPYIQSVANASVGTGPWGMGNKGAVATKVAVSLPYPNSRPFEVCFINAHLSAHLNETRRRNDDYLAICRRMIFVEEKDRSRNDVHVNSDSANSYAGLHTMNDDDHHSNSGSSGSSIGGIGGVGGGVDEDDVDDDSDDTEDFYHMDQDQQPLLNGRGRSSGGGGGIGGHGRGTTTTTTPSSERVRKRINRPKGPRKFGSSKKPSVEKTIFSCDYIFWTGDLNYRLDLEESDGTLQKKKGGAMTMLNTKMMMKKKPSREDLLSQPTPSPMSASEFVHAIESGHYRALYAHDQLSAQRKTMNVFKGFHEAPLAFAPTYKFRMGTSKYDIRKRIPAWTDRVLWFVHPHDASSVERATEDEVDAWDEHSTGLGYGKLPMESTIRRSRSLYASSDFGMPGPPGVGAGATVESIASATSILEGPLNKSLATHRSDSMSIRSNSSSSSSKVGGGDGGDARAGTSGSESRSRGTFSSLAKRGSARVPVLDQQMFQPPRASTTLVHSPSTMSLASQSSNGTTMAHLHSSGGGGEPSMTTMASSASLLSNRSGRNSGGVATTATTNSNISPGAGGAAAAAAAGGAGAGIGPSSTFLTSSSSSSSLLQAQQVAQRVETSTSPLLIHYYTSHSFYVSSDHKPVSALFTLLPHNLATQLQVSPYGIDRHWRLKKFMGKKLTTIAGHLLRWGFLVMGFIALVGLFVFVRRHLHGW
ncbi:hypothetical protein DFQ26_007389 [Actinomortierella ambigua]|nr:hypothetical protein DFQ26_007389 [Actinomortierella ambigua]